MLVEATSQAEFLSWHKLENSGFEWCWSETAVKSQLGDERDDVKFRLELETPREMCAVENRRRWREEKNRLIWLGKSSLVMSRSRSTWNTRRVIARCTLYRKVYWEYLEIEKWFHWWAWSSAKYCPKVDKMNWRREHTTQWEANSCHEQINKNRCF